jgi:hypothetical protein
VTDGGLALSPLATWEPACIEICGIDKRAAIFRVQIKELHRRIGVNLASDAVCPVAQLADFDTRVT